MAMNAQYQTGSYTRTAEKLSAQSMIEIKFSASDLGEAVAVYPQISLNLCEISSGRANYSGRLVATLVYIGEDGKLAAYRRARSSLITSITKILRLHSARIVS